MKNMEWVFWVSINKRKWFKLFWTTRGSNFREVQIFGLVISIGLPWLNDVIEGYKRDYTFKAEEYIKKTNSDNLKHKFSILIK